MKIKTAHTQSQSDLLCDILEPGVYAVNRTWKNEMGYTWKLNSHVFLLHHNSPEYCTCALPEGAPSGLVFHLSTDRLRSCFKRFGPLPATVAP